MNAFPRRILWAIKILLALAFAGAAFAKLSGAPEMVALFDAIGFGQWFRVFTGAVEATGAVLVLIPGTSFLGALWLAGTMLGAVATHLFRIGGSPLAPVVLGLLATLLAYLSRPPWLGGRRPD